MDLLVEVLRDDGRFLVVAKPSGLFVHRTSLNARERDVLLTRVRDHVGHRVFPVHRLDRPTSGMVLFAHAAEHVAAGQDALARGTKTYLALVRGTADSLPAAIERPLRPPKKTEPVPAITDLQVLARAPSHRCALIAARPRTGRFHQVRRHLAGAGSPILLDSKHGETRIHPHWRALGLERLFLHLARLQLPALGFDVAAPLPLDLGSVLQTVDLAVPPEVYGPGPAA